MLNECYEVVDGLKIKYLFKPRKYDCNYLIVVFSGFGANNYFTYDLKNTLSGINSNVLWIKDDFFDNVSYYYSAKGEILHEKINNFIEKFSQKINIAKDKIILSGFSKGGSAALLFGCLYNYKNIVCTVPQFKIASYCLQTKKQDVVHHMGGASEIDEVILKAIDLDKNLEKNIYFLTSEADEQYASQIKPYVSSLYKYKNFNLFYSESILVRSHNQVTSHHLQLILSWYYALISGAVPRYGITLVKGDEINAKNEIDFSDIFIELRKFSAENRIIYPEGVALVRGVDHEKWHEVDFVLILQGENNYYEFDLAQDSKPSLIKEFYDGNFTIYDKSWFCTYRYKGIDLSKVKAGIYRVKLTLKLNKFNKDITSDLKSSIINNISYEKIKLKFDKICQLEIED